MNIKRILSAAMATVIVGSTLVSCSQPNLENLLLFNEEKVSKYTSSVEGSALTLYVDANATEGGDGSESAPFKTIQDAQAKIRELKAGEGLPAGGVTVLVKSGDYRLFEGLKFTEEDSGTAESPITYVSEEEFGAILNGGIILSADDFEPINDEEKSRIIDKEAAGNIVKVDLSKYGISETDWGKMYSIGQEISDDEKKIVEAEIFINGERLIPARYPNNDFLKTVTVVDNGDSYYSWSSDLFENGSDPIYNYNDFNSNPTPRGGSFTIEKSAAERISQWSTLEDVCIFAYFKFGWTYSKQFVKDIDVENAIIYNSEANYHGLSRNAPFYLFNIFDELDSDGEYYLDRDSSTLYLYASESFDSAEIMLSCGMSEILVAENASYITLKGFGACATISDGFNISGNNFNIDNCKIYNVRKSGIIINGDNNIVQNCEIANVGAFGISLTGGDNETLTKGNCLVYNNYIHKFSQVDRVYTPAISLYGCGNTASHNEICNSPHEAITWNGAYQTIEYNEIYNVCYETSDCGAIYAGRNTESYGSVIRYNLIYDIGSGDSFVCGIYFDDGLAGQTAYGNIIMNSTRYGLLLGCGRDLNVYNNIIINTDVFNERAIDYDERFYHAVVEEKTMWIAHFPERAEGLEKIQKNEIWCEVFPELVKCHMDPEGLVDVDSPDFLMNPANSVIRNNIAFVDEYETETPGQMMSFAESVYMYSTVENNPVVVDFNAHDYLSNYIKYAKKVFPEFEYIPCDDIGRIE